MPEVDWDQIDVLQRIKINEGACKGARKARSLGYKGIDNENWIKEKCKSGFQFF